MPSFDRLSPFRPSFAWLVAQPVPSAAENRRRFVHSLASMDSQAIVDGGWLLPLGQEDALRPLATAYRRLPAVRFSTLTESPDGSPAGPVTFRWADVDGRTVAYVVNDAPFAMTAQVHLEAPPACRVSELSGQRQVAPITRDADGGSWTADLQPYDFLAVEFSEPGVRLAHPQVTLPESVSAALALRIRELGVRAATLRNPQPLKVLDNAGFEQAPAIEDPVPGWAISRRSGVTIQTDTAQAHGGKRAARISSDGPVACLVSRWFDVPATGRLSMLVWLRVSDPARQPRLRLAVEGKLDGRDYYRFAPVGQSAAAGQTPFAIGTQWRQYFFQVDDLPLTGLAQLHVRFDLMGAGEVWVDDVQLYDMALGEANCRPSSSSLRWPT